MTTGVKDGFNGVFEGALFAQQRYGTGFAKVKQTLSWS